MLNRVVIVGRLVRDPELRKTASDRSVVAFTVALDNRTQIMVKNQQVTFHAQLGIAQLKVSLNL